MVRALLWQAGHPRTQSLRSLHAPMHRWRGSRLSLTLSVVLGTLAACGDATGPTNDTDDPEPGPLASIEVSPADRKVWIGLPFKFSAIGRDANGTELPGVNMSWTSSDTAVAKVASDGVVDAIAAGTTILTATAEGVSGSADLEVVAVRFQSISTGYHFTCGVAVDSTAACWGYDDGRLGFGATQSQWITAPRPVASSAAFGTIDASFFHSCAVTGDNTAYCWGDNEFGGLGAPSQDMCQQDFAPYPCSATPSRVGGGYAFASVTAGTWFSCGVDAVGVGLCWGTGTVGQLGNGRAQTEGSPQAINGDLSFATVSAANGFACGLTTDGQAYCWGSNRYGAIGSGSPQGPSTCETSSGTLPCVSSPWPVTGGHVFTQVDAGGEHACGVTANGSLYCWGGNQWGTLGVPLSETTELCHGTIHQVVGDSVPCSTTPVKVASEIQFASVVTGGATTCAVATDGSGYCWGYNRYGVLGVGMAEGPELCADGRSSCSYQPVEVAGGHTWITIAPSASSTHTCGITTDGVAYCWGGNWDGELGINSQDGDPHPFPERVYRQ